MRPSFRNRILFVEQNKVNIHDPAVSDLLSVENIIWHTKKPELKWIEHSTELIGDWRSFVRSVYMRWAITINALHVARDRYEANPNIALAVDTLRPSDEGPQRVHLAVWPGAKAAENYATSIPLIAAYGVQDLYGALEEIVFALYEIFLEAHPERLMHGDEFKPMRKLYREKNNGPEAAAAYAAAWSGRIETWRRKRAYDGLHKVFAAFWVTAKLVRPSWYKLSDIDDWTKTIETIGEIRHLIVHGEDRVSKRLSDLCTEQPALGLAFAEGERLEVHLVDLMIVEEFLDKLLSTLNRSLIELAHGAPLPKPDNTQTNT